MPEPHTCHAFACTTPCPPEQLMCKKHWAMVPRRTQREVYNAYRLGQCDDKHPSAAWFLAAERAIVTVALKEGRMSSVNGAARIERVMRRFALHLPPEEGA